MRSKLATIIMTALVTVMVVVGLSYAVNRIWWTVNVTVTPGDFVIPIGKEVVNVEVQVGDKSEFTLVLMNRSEEEVPFQFTQETIIEGLTFYMPGGVYDLTAPAMLQSTYGWVVAANPTMAEGSYTQAMFADDIP